MAPQRESEWDVIEETPESEWDIIQEAAAKATGIARIPTTRLRLTPALQFDIPHPTIRRVAEALPYVGAGIGAAAAAPLGPVGPPTGAYVVGAGGEAAAQLVKRAFGLPDVPRRPAEAAEAILGRGAEQLGYEAVGMVAGPAVRAVGRRLAEVPRLRTAPGAVAGRPVPAAEIERLAPTLRLTPGERAGPTGPGAVLRQIQRGAEFGVIAPAIAEPAQRIGTQEALRVADDVVASLGREAGPVRTGQVFRNALRLGEQAFQARGEQLFERELLPLGERVAANAAPIAAEANRIIQREVFDLATISGTGAAAKLLDRMSKLPQNPSFSHLLAERKWLWQFYPARERLLAGDPAEGLAKHFEQMIFTQLDDAARSAGAPKELLPLWTKARTFWREGRRVFDSQFVKKLIRTNPEAAAQSVRPGAVTDALTLRRAFLSFGKYAQPAQKAEMNAAWDRFRQQFIRSRLLRDPEAAGIGVTDLVGLKKRMNTYGRETLETLVATDARGRLALENLRALAETTSRIQPTHAAHALVRWIEFAAIPAAVVGGILGERPAITGAGLGIELVPTMISLTLFSRRATELLRRGLTAATRERAIANMVRAFEFAVSDNRMPQPGAETLPAVPSLQPQETFQ